ncbi:MAG: redoxin domain-containing protein [Planctomycetota bacterium]
MQPSPASPSLNWSQRALLVFLAAAGLGLIGWSMARYWKKPEPGPAVVDIAQDVKDYLQKRNVRPLSEPLQKILADESVPTVKTQAHPLLDHAAPDFDLVDSGKIAWKLTEARKTGPVVLIFYYGYHCNHCVGQLFAINNDLPLFKEMGATVVAVSADPPELTRERFKKYGAFAFPVVTDPGNKTAAAYGSVQPVKGKDDDVLHGTFIIDRQGIVRWANVGDEPFTDNRTLLRELAKLK